MPDPKGDFSIYNYIYHQNLNDTFSLTRFITCGYRTEIHLKLEQHICFILVYFVTQCLREIIKYFSSL